MQGRPMMFPSPRLPAFEPLEPRLLLDAHPIINEFMANNQATLRSSDGLYHDWIEIHNPTDHAVSLGNWKLKDSDKEWIFPDMTLAAGAYRVVFASRKNLRNPAYDLHTNFRLDADGEYLALIDDADTVVQEFAQLYPPQVKDISFGPSDPLVDSENLVGPGTSLAALIPENDALGTTWRGAPAQEPFDVSGWLAGDTSVGFDDDPGGPYHSYIIADVHSSMLDENASAYIRYSFQVADVDQLRELTLGVRYDDGFVCWLNGVKIAERNPPGVLQFDSAASDEHPDDQAVLLEDIDVTAWLGELREGDNVLAVQGLNVAYTDGDFLIEANLVAEREIPGEGQYFTDPTPWQPNTVGALGRVKDTNFSADRGFFDEPFYVTITTDTDGAEIRYTTDGTAPTATHGDIFDPAHPIHVDGLMTLRAAAFKPGYVATNVDTQTYFFLDDVIDQDGSGLPASASWGRYGRDWEMDPQIVGVAPYEDTIRDDLLSVPTLSLVMPWDDWFGSGGQGIYISGEGVPKACSAELILPDGSDGFQIDCSVQIQGGTSTSRWKCNKLSMRLKFKEEYGPGELDYDLFEGTIFEEGAATSFDTLVLDARMNQTWIHGSSGSQRDMCQYTRDQYMSDLQTAVGGYAPRGKYVHVYLNGLYWGMYGVHERPDEHFNADYQGGFDEDYDVIKHSSGNIVNGSNANYLGMFSVANSGLSTPEKYAQIQQYVDVPDFINYMLTNFYAGNTDWAHHNWYASRNRSDPDSRWRFHQWDAEHVLKGEGDNVTSRDNDRAPTRLHQRLCANAEYKMLFADQVHEHFYNGGPFSVEGATALYQNILDEIEQAIVCESARWGDTYTSTPYTWDDWARERDRLLGSYFPGRTNTVLNQLRSRGLYPQLDAPELRVNGLRQHGGYYLPGDGLTFDNPDGVGTIYYTLDGTDPREPGGGLSSRAIAYGGGSVPIEENVHVKARVRNGTSWSALCGAEYFRDVRDSLRVTEVMYHAPDPTDAERAAGFTDDDLFEYVELINIGDEAIPLDRVRFVEGIRFTLPEMELEPDCLIVVAANRQAFDARYDIDGSGIVVAGEYEGSLDNGGEGIRLRTPVGDLLQDFRYDDAWYGLTDGDGYSLTIVDPGGGLANWSLEAGWKASHFEGGTPGAHDSGLRPGAVVVNEVLTHSDFAPNDWIELYNTTGQDIDVGGWFLSDSQLDLAKYQIPSPMMVPAHNHRVLTEDGHFGTAFALSEHGDDVYLSSNEGGLPGGYREHVDFGTSPNGQSIGLYTKQTGTTDFCLLTGPTMNDDNAPPWFGPLVINEVMYHPTDPDPAGGYVADDYEFLELYNRSGGTLNLTKFFVGEGIGFSFGWYDADGFGTELRTLQAGATAAWQASLPTGEYEVFARWNTVDANGRARRLDRQARYTIAHDGGPTDVFRDQSEETGPGGWVSLGTYDFDGPASVTLTRGADEADRWTMADQVKFVGGTTPVLVDNASAEFSCSAATVTQLDPGGYVVLVKNADAFASRYDTAGMTIAGAYSGRLANGGERVKVYRALSPEVTGYIPYVRADYVNYDDALPWPTEADGLGASLSRWPADAYGNDALNWVPGTTDGSPGARNTFYDSTPPSVPQDVQAQAVTSRRIDLGWPPSTDPQSSVHHYVIYRDGVPLDTSPTAGYIDSGLAQTRTYTYEITAVNPDGHESARSSPVQAAPRVSLKSAETADGVHVTVTFGKSVDRTSAETIGNYEIFGGQGQPASLLGAERQSDTRVVVLTLSAALPENADYTLRVTGVTDLVGSPIEKDAEAAFTYKDVESRLLAWWTFDEGAGETALDASGHGRDARIAGAEWNANGRVDGALAFDGGDTVADEDGEAYVNGLEGFTIALWIQADATGGDHGIFTVGVPGGTGCLALQHSAVGAQAGQSNTFTALLSTDAGSGLIEGPADAQSTNWQHLALTWASGDPVRLYLDGEPQTLSYDSGPLAGRVNGATQVLLGMAQSGSQEGWRGLLDDVRIYDRPLDVEEIEELVNVAGRLSANIIAVHPDPRNTTLDEVQIVFNRPVTGFDLSDLRLTRDGGGNLLTGGERLETTDNVTWTLSRLARLTGTGGSVSGFTAFNDHVTGTGTHPNATTYAGNGTASGLLKDVGTGEDAAARLSITTAGIRYEGTQGSPAAGTDVYSIFNGFVDFSGRSGSGASLALTGAAQYIQTFSGLDTGDDAAYHFAGSAVRGRDDYPNRWTLVTLIGAEDFTAAHSSGEGVVTDGLGPNQVAIWTGANHRAGQGYVAAWTDIDPGPDGEFSVRSQQYTGSIPTSVYSPGVANGSKGYGISGLRLEEVVLLTPEPIAGAYDLTLTAEGSGIQDAEAAPLAADAARGWVIDTEPPAVDIADVSPDPISAPVPEIDIVFDEPVVGLDVADLALTRDGGANLLTDEGLITSDNRTYTLVGLTELTRVEGTYTLTLTSGGSGITDLAGNALAGGAAETWVADIPIAPTITRLERNDGAHRPSELTSLAIQFSQNVSASLDAAHLALRNDSTGQDVDLAGVTLDYDAETDTARWDLAGVAVDPAYYTVILDCKNVTNSEGLPVDESDDLIESFLVALGGDADLDGEVGPGDFVALRASFGQAGPGWAGGDFDYSGGVDAFDYLTLKRNVGRSVPPETVGSLAGDADVDAPDPTAEPVAETALSALPASDEAAPLGAAAAAWYDADPPSAPIASPSAAAAPPTEPRVPAPPDGEAILPDPMPQAVPVDVLGDAQGSRTPSAPEARDPANSEVARSEDVLDVLSCPDLGIL